MDKWNSCSSQHQPVIIPIIFPLKRPLSSIKWPFNPMKYPIQSPLNHHWIIIQSPKKLEDPSSGTPPRRQAIQVAIAPWRPTRGQPPRDEIPGETWAYFPCVDQWWWKWDWGDYVGWILFNCGLWYICMCMYVCMLCMCMYVCVCM